MVIVADHEDVRLDRDVSEPPRDIRRRCQDAATPHAAVVVHEVDQQPDRNDLVPHRGRGTHEQLAVHELVAIPSSGSARTSALV